MAGWLGLVDITIYCFLCCHDYNGVNYLMFCIIIRESIIDTSSVILYLTAVSNGNKAY